MSRRSYAATVAISMICLLSATTAAAQDERGFVRALGGVTFGGATSSIVGGGFGYTVRENVQVTFEVGRMQNVIPGEIRDSVDEIVDEAEDDGFNVDFDFKVPAVYFTAGVRLNVPTMSSRFKPFVEAGVGAARISADLHLEIDGTDFTDLLEDEIGELPSETKFLFNIGLGITTEVRENVSLDVAYRFSRINTEDPAINSNALYASLRFNFK